jgi:hypothetical protein
VSQSIYIYIYIIFIYLFILVAIFNPIKVKFGLRETLISLGTKNIDNVFS